MKIVRIIGGLGNQMFQYAFMKALKEEMPNEQILADTSYFKGYKLHNGLELENVFGIILKKAHWRELIKITIPMPLFQLSRAREKAGLVLPWECLEERFKGFIPLDRIANKRYFWGYWQDERYFKHIKEKLLRDFSFPALDGKNASLMKSLRGEETCAMHIRRGDYLKHPMYRGLCGINYYKNAIVAMQQRVEGVRFVVFSNDMMWVNNNLKTALGGDAIFVDWNKGSDSFRDMQLMNLCRHNIIANSSFSWWGAWLNRNESKIVIAPGKWLNCSPNFNPACDSWIKM